MSGRYMGVDFQAVGVLPGYRVESDNDTLHSLPTYINPFLFVIRWSSAFHLSPM